uniref:Uncharacterized protein n=1 Tax=Sphaerodactylus townsendi TaxID=933632 RepID=A0ACB8E7Z9_9SAUR
MVLSLRPERNALYRGEGGGVEWGREKEKRASPGRGVCVEEREDLKAFKESREVGCNKTIEGFVRKRAEGEKETLETLGEKTAAGPKKVLDGIMRKLPCSSLLPEQAQCCFLPSGAAFAWRWSQRQGARAESNLSSKLQFSSAKEQNGTKL